MRPEFMSSQLPPGRYLARLVRRKGMPPEQRGGTEYVFIVSQGEYAGERVPMRLWASGRIERANEMQAGEVVEIRVGALATGSRRGISVVQDFRKLSRPTAVDAVRGRDDSTPRVEREGEVVDPGTFRPFPLLTESDWEWANSFDDEAYRELPVNVPLLDDAVVEEVLAAGQGTDVPTCAPISEAPDDCEADDDAEFFRWVVLRSGTGDPAPVPLGDVWDAPPLQVAPETAKQPVSASIFRYTDDLPSYMESHGHSVRGFAGLAWSCWLAVRLRSEEGLPKIIKRARTIAIACARLGVPREQILAMNSWNTGLTLFIPSGIAGAAPQVGYERVAGHFAQALTDLACLHTFDLPVRDNLAGVKLPTDRRKHARIDRQMYGPVAVHPAFNSAEPLGKGFAVALSYDELVGLEPDELQKLSAVPRPVPHPNWRAEPIGVFEELWTYAIEAERMRSRRFAWLVADSPFIHADTFDWMLHGALPEYSSKRLFRAAVNLLRIGCKPDVVTQLLGPGAHISGLDRQDVEEGVRFAAESLVSEGFYLDEHYD